MANKFSSELTLNTFTPVIPTGPSAAYAGAPVGDTTDDESSKKGKGTTIGGLDESMIKWLYEKGLKSDVLAFLTEMDYAISNAYDPITGKPNIAMYKMLLPRLAQLDQEKLQFYKALDSMRSNDAIDEIAINARGEVYVADAELGIISKDIKDVKLGDRLITNGELAYLRALNPSAAFDFDLTLTISNGVSTTQITKFLNDSLSGLGKSSVSNESYFNASGLQLKGAEILRELANNGSLLKVLLENTSQALEAKNTLRYLIAILPTNMKRVLQAKALASNTSMEVLVSSFISSKVDNETKTKYDIETNKNAESETSLSKLQLDPVSMFALGKTPEFSFKMDTGGKYAFIGIAHLGHLLDDTGKPLSPYASLQDVFTGQFSGILDLNNVTMGSMKIRSFDEVRIANNQVSSIELPVDTSSDIIKPDLALLAKIQLVEQKLSDDGVAKDDYDKINEYYANAGLQIKYDNNGNLTQAYARFAVISAYANQEALEAEAAVDEGPDGTVSPVTDDNLKTALARHFEQRRGSTKVYTIDEDNLIQGNVFIPIISPQNGYQQAILAAYQTNNTNMNVGLAKKLQEKAGKNDAQNLYGFVPGGSFTE